MYKSTGAHRGQERLRSPGAIVAGGCEPPRGCREWSRVLCRHHEILTTVPSLQPLNYILNELFYFWSTNEMNFMFTVLNIKFYWTLGYSVCYWYLNYINVLAFTNRFSVRLYIQISFVKIVYELSFDILCYLFYILKFIIYYYLCFWLLLWARREFGHWKYSKNRPLTMSHQVDVFLRKLFDHLFFLSLENEIFNWSESQILITYVALQDYTICILCRPEWSSSLVLFRLPLCLCQCALGRTG